MIIKKDMSAIKNRLNIVIQNRKGFLALCNNPRSGEIKFKLDDGSEMTSNIGDTLSIGEMINQTITLRATRKTEKGPVDLDDKYILFSRDEGGNALLYHANRGIIAYINHERPWAVVELGNPCFFVFSKQVCPCCKSIDEDDKESGSSDICLVCYWSEYEDYRAPTLDKAIQNYLEVGTSTGADPTEKAMIYSANGDKTSPYKLESQGINLGSVFSISGALTGNSVLNFDLGITPLTSDESSYFDIRLRDFSIPPRDPNELTVIEITLIPVQDRDLAQEQALEGKESGEVSAYSYFHHNHIGGDVTLTLIDNNNAIITFDIELDGHPWFTFEESRTKIAGSFAICRGTVVD